jgi:AbrB family looped-hinge helix DNA binding protein
LTIFQKSLTITNRPTIYESKGELIMATTAKITKKGQVTIPQKIRERLGTEVIEFAITGSEIVIRPVKSVAGSLSAYGRKEKVPFKELRETAWEEAAQERYGKKADRH